MSAITSDPILEASGLGAGDGVRRYHTTVRVLVHSHNQGASDPPLDLSDDTLSCTLGKTIKGVGQANLTVVPNKNYLNALYPNDLINIYFNLSDGNGWVRCFFGFIDKVEETYSVTANGNPTTAYRILCSDFMKALAKTEIYFNPHVAGRDDFAGGFIGTPNIGGVALYSRGITLHGSPPDMVLNLLFLLFVFGSQFTLPSNYAPRSQQRLRTLRRNYVLGRLGEDVQREVASVGGWEAIQDRYAAHARIQATSVQAMSSEEARYTALEEQFGLSRSDLAGVDIADVAALSQALYSQRMLRDIYGAGRDGRSVHAALEQSRELGNIIHTTNPAHPPSLLDIIDSFTFVERRAMDGYHAGHTVWQRQGSLLSIIRSFSHELMNELVFDLRPLSVPVGADSGAGSGDEINEALVDGSTFSRASDDIGGNIARSHEPTTATGIQYVPAMIMREYPFSTLDNIDAEGVNISLTRGNDNTTFGHIGVLHFGAIFSHERNRPGRHVITTPNINVADLDAGISNSPARKHIDVAVISEGEITKTVFGRSDHEHYNLLEFWSDSVLGQDMKWYMQDLLPIMTPIHVMRHGLRVRSLTTNFARYSTTVASNTQDNAANEAGEAAQEETAPASVSRETPRVDPRNLGLPLVSRGAPVPPEIEGRQLARYSASDIHAWGYRQKVNIGPGGSWVMHQGIDICPIRVGPGALTVAETQDIAITAIADGDVVVSAPDGVSTGYGNIVVIKHNFAGQTRFSAYAHLHRRTVGPDQGVATARKVDAGKYFANVRGILCGRPRTMAPIRVTKGQTIGYMGATGGRMGPHLHFEIDTVFPPRRDPRVPTAVPRYHFVAPPDSWGEVGGFHPGPGSQRGVWSETIRGRGSEPTPPATVRSEDPVAFYQTQGIRLQRSIASGSIVTGATAREAADPDPDQPTEGPAWDATNDADETNPSLDPTRISGAPRSSIVPARYSRLC